MSRTKQAFTLIEILIVVIILGILAAVVIPQFSEASNDTRVSSVMTDVKLLRSQIQLYKAQHNEVYPTTWGPSGQLDMYTDVSGNTNATYTTTFRFGPYLLRVPPNPFTGQNTVTVVAGGDYPAGGAADMNQGWWYNSATGEVRCHVPDPPAGPATPDGTAVNTL
ncbi:MAG TPA: prepilin-type N-terminal cleavage/methylation domain-containing protein [Phycisphaerae bacterium]|nr:prepilin-type N-terminal cleavage/methylation domain-containing protein [Phycisphaerae bacterium]HOI54076.1 prepilin-type N-terminal cleavage/methylation domain-containing protein [Phycisphaerae bacterium]